MKYTIVLTDDPGKPQGLNIIQRKWSCITYQCKVNGDMLDNVYAALFKFLNPKKPIKKVFLCFLGKFAYYCIFNFILKKSQKKTNL